MTRNATGGKFSAAYLLFTKDVVRWAGGRAGTLRGITVTGDFVRSDANGRPGEGDLRLSRNTKPALERQYLRSHRKRTAVNPMKKPETSEFLEIATDRILGNAEARHELGDHDSAVALESSEYLVSTLCNQHRYGL